MEEEWYFTFGSNQLDNDGNSLADCYFVIRAKNQSEARKKMFDLRSDKWAFQYSKKEFGNQAEDFNLKEAKKIKIQIKKTEE